MAVVRVENSPTSSDIKYQQRFSEAGREKLEKECQVLLSHYKKKKKKKKKRSIITLEYAQEQGYSGLFSWSGMGKGKGLVGKIRYIIVSDIESGHVHEHLLSFMMLDAMLGMVNAGPGTE